MCLAPGLSPVPDDKQMRTRLTDQLSGLNQTLGAMAELTTQTISHATTALLKADLAAAE